MASEPLPSAAKRNVELITQIERQLVERRSRAEQVGDAIAHFFGSLRFIVLHAVALVVWLAWNSGLAGLEPFDPYPFPLLGLVVGVEFILLTTFVLMNQKKQSRRQEQWAHLNLQVCLLTEQEVTKNVQMLHLICKHLKLAEPAQDREVSELARATSVSELAKEIDKAQ